MPRANKPDSSSAERRRSEVLLSRWGGWGNRMERETEVKSWATTLGDSFIFLCFSVGSLYISLPELWYCFTLYNISHPIQELSQFCSTPYPKHTSNSSWHIVKCLVNTGLMNKWPRSRQWRYWNWGKHSRKTATGQSSRGVQVAKARRQVWRIAPRFWFGEVNEWWYYQRENIEGEAGFCGLLRVFQFIFGCQD